MTDFSLYTFPLLAFLVRVIVIVKYHCNDDTWWKWLKTMMNSSLGTKIDKENLLKGSKVNFIKSWETKTVQKIVEELNVNVMKKMRLIKIVDDIATKVAANMDVMSSLNVDTWL